MHHINIKPLSINEAWKGRRFKTKAYEAYADELYLLLPKLVIDPKAELYVYLQFGFSSRNADLDNPAKLCIDVMSKKFGINDRNIYELQIVKEIVPKGSEYIKFDIGVLQN